LVGRQAGELYRLGTRSDDAEVKVNALGSTASHHFDDIGADETANTLNDFDLTLLGKHAQTARQFVDDAVLESAQLFEVDRGLAEGDAMGAHGFGVLDHLGGM